MFTSSRRLILDFSEIPADCPDELNVQKYFDQMIKNGENPRRPENRQRFNNNALSQTGMRYLVSGYAENRIAMLGDTQIAREGRSYHLGIDIFSQDLEPVLAPSDGQILRTGFEEGFGGYGNYLIFRPEVELEDPEYKVVLLFLGHLAGNMTAQTVVKQGDQIAQLGDYKNNENGGWSRHLHLQALTEMPKPGTTPIGYSSSEALEENLQKFPDPFSLFPEWRVE